MSEALNLFPERAAIGRVDARGNVYMTPEFTRALATLLVRVGGPVGSSMDELALELATGGVPVTLHLERAVEELEHKLAQSAELTARMAQMSAALEQLAHEAAQAEQLTARLAQLRQHVEALEALDVGVTPPTDWEHPGKIGASTASSGRFTTVEATTAATQYGAAHLGGLPFGGKYYAGFIAGRARVLNQAGGFGYIYDPAAPGSSFFHLTPYGSTEGAAFKLDTLGNLKVSGGFGCNTKPPQGAFVLGAAATDLPTVITLANNLRTMALNNGIGT
jgi:hypothetical protein